METITNPQTDHQAQDAQRDRQQPPGGPGRLDRPMSGRMLAGVAAGIADYLGVEAAIVRIALVVLTVMGGAGVPLYLAGWLLIPEEGCAQSIAAAFLESRSSRSG